MKPKPAKIADVAHRRQSAFCVKFVIYGPLRPDYRITRLWVKLYWVVYQRAPESNTFYSGSGLLSVLLVSINWQLALARHGKAMLIPMVL